MFEFGDDGVLEISRFVKACINSFSSHIRVSFNLEHECVYYSILSKNQDKHFVPKRRGHIRFFTFIV